MEKEFISYDQALALKELGFDEPCIGWYNPQVNYKKVTTDRYWAFHLTGEWENFKPSPLYQQAFKWFREKHGVYTEIFVDDDKTFGFMITHFTSEGRVDSPVKYGHITYEEAESACLDKLIQIVTGTTESSHTK